MADRAFLLARRGVVELHVSTFILDEVARVLAEEFGWVAARIHEPEEAVDIIEDDTTDNRILECALAAHAQTLVAGDKKHLLPLGSFRGASIVGLRDFLASFTD